MGPWGIPSCCKGARAFLGSRCGGRLQGRGVVIEDAGHHTVAVAEEDGVFTARCSCGWAGKPARTQGIAENDGLAHLDVTI